MAKVTINQLYDNLKEDGWVEKDFDNFKQFFFATGEQGYKNRKALYDNMREDGYVDSPTYEDFMDKIDYKVGKSPSTSAATPMAQAVEESSSSPTEVTEQSSVQHQKPWQPSLQDRLRASWEIAQDVNNFKQGNKAVREKVKRQAEMITPEGRQKAKVAKASAKLVGADVETPLFGGAGSNAGDATMRTTPARQPASAQSPQVASVKFDENGQPITEWMLPDGTLTTDRQQVGAAEERARASRLQHEFEGRMREKGLDPSKPEDVQKQAIYEEVGQELEEAYREKEALEAALNKRKEELDKEHDNVGLGTRILRGLSEAAISSKDPHAIRDDNEARNYTADKQYNQLTAAIRHNRQAINILEDKRRGRMNEFWLNLGKEMVNGYTFDYGKGQLNDSRALNDAADLVDTINEKRRKGEALNEEEQTAELLLTSLARRNSTEGRFGGDYGAWARAGKMASHSIELLPDFAMGGMSLMQSVTTKSLAKMGLKEVAKGFGNKVMRATGIGLGTLAGGAVMTNTIQAPRLLGQTAANMDGQLRMDSDGNYIIDGKEGFMTSFLKAQRELISENASEAVGEFLPSGKFVRELVGKGLEKVGLSKLNNTLASIGGKEWYQNTNIALKQMGFNGTVNEGLEEYAGIGYQTLMGDGDAFRSLADWDTHIDIWLGTVTMGALLNTPQYIGTAAYGAQYAKAKHGLNKNDKAGASVYGERWEGIKSQIDGMQNENVAGVLITMLTDGTASTKEERQALLDYAGSLQRMRGLNIGQMMGGSAQDAEVAQTYSSGYEASTPQEMVDAQNMYEYQRQRLVNELGSIGEENIENILAEVESDPVGALNKTYDPALRDIVMDYANAKTVRDGMIQRVNDGIDEQIAQSNAIIDGRINKESGLIVPATMGLDDRQVYVVSGNIVANEDGSIDRDASDESVIVRNAQTGELEFTDPRSLSSLGEAIDPEEERATATEAIRQQSAQAAVDAMNGTLAFNPGDIITIDNNGMQVTVIGPVVDAETGMAVENQVVVQLPDGNQSAFTKEELQQWSDAANLERLNNFEQERNATRAQQQAAEAEAKRPQFALNDEFTILDEDGNHIRGSITGELDDDGTIEIYTENPVNGKLMNRLTPEELAGMVVTYNGQDVLNNTGNPQEEIVGNAVITEDNSVNLQHGNGPEQNNDERAQPREADGGPVAPDPAGSLETSRDRSDIRVYEDGLAAKYNDYSEHSERDRREAESERLVGIAKSEGQYYDRKRIETLGEKRPKPSGESEIYVDAPKRRIYKVKNPYAKSPMKGNVQPEDAIYEHLVHNKYFPETAYKFEGISDDLGDARIVLSQELVESVGQATKEQIDAALAEKGLLPEGKYTYGNDEISVTDVTGDNALLGNDGKVYFIDPIINFKKPVSEILGEIPAAEAAAPNQSEEIQPTALSRIPVDEEGEPLFDQTDPATAWDGMTEYFGGPEDAIEFARSRVKTLKDEKDRLAKAVDNIKATGSAKEFKDAKAKARASLAAKQAQLDHWNNVVNAKIAREQADAEAQRQAEEAERERNRQAYLAAESERRQQEEARRKEQERKATLDADLAAEAERQSLLPETQEQTRAANSFDGYIEQMRQEILSRGAGEQRQRLNERIRTASGAKQYGEIYAALSEEQGPVTSLEEWVTRALSVNKQRVKWTGEGNLRGQIFAAGKKEKVSEVKQLQWMISDREGIPFWDFVHKMWETLSADNSAGFNREAITDQDVRNMVIEVLRSHPTSRSLFESAIDMYDTRMASDTIHGELQEMEHYMDDIRDQWYRENMGMEYDEYTARVEAIYSEIRRSELTDEDIDAINSEIADEQQNINDNGTDNEGALRSGAESVQAEQSDGRAGDAPADVERPETTGRRSDSESGGLAAEAEASELNGDEASDGGQSAGIADKIAAAEAEVNTDPTPAQKEAGNYKKGHVQVGTFDVSIEQPVGSVRRGTDADGKEWETTMQNTYGYIRGTQSVDGDHIDVFLSTDIDAWNGRRVVIVDQYNPNGSFDEHKVMLGFNDKSEAINAYLANYEEGWEKGRRLVFSTATLEDFEKWIESSHRKQKPYHEYKIAEKAEVDESTPENPVSATYTIDTYTTKKNKTYHRVVFPRADKAVWQERLNLAKKMGGTSIPKGYGFKTQEEAEAFAKVIADPAAVADAQPLSLDDMRSSIEEAPTATATEAEQVTETETQQPEADKPINPSGNKLVTDERYAELRERMRKKFGQLNMGVDPEILAIGTEMAVYHIEKGARKFKAYASAMIADLGDAIRPYLKSFYNAVRDMPEAEAAGLVADMDSYDEVRSVDIANFDKPSADALATAAAVVAEQEAEKEREEAEAKLKEKRKKRTNPDGSTTETVVESGTEIEITSGDFIPGVRPAIDEQKPGKKKSGKTKPTTDGGLFDTVEVPALVVPEQRPATDLIGDSTAFQEREAQTAELVEEIGGVIESRVAMLQLDAESVKPLTMTDVKKMASKYPALNDISDTDLQELVELAMTQLTRSEALINIDGTAEAQRRAYDHIVNLYKIQPSLNARDSERLIKQQYSTPTPFGFVMGQFVRAGGKTVGSMLEPSAGNGALTITVHPSLVHVNDIDEARLANLRKLGYGQVTAQDALLPFAGDKVDVVMTNPPFGTVTEKVYDGIFHVSSLEAQMAINALEKMKDDGRAAIVIGGNTSYRTNGSMNPKDAAFFGYLYSHYNVADVINISGKALYSRNGTGYDVRMILIDGRKTGEFQRVFPLVKAKARAEQVTTFDELYKRVQDDIQQIQQVGSQSADVQREPETATDGTASAPVRTGNNRPNTGAGQRPGTTGDAVRDTPRTDSGLPTPGNDGSSPAGVDNAITGNDGSTDNVSQPKPQQPRSVGSGSAQDGTGRSGSDGRGAVASRPDRRAERLEVKPDLTTEKVPYPNQSENGFTLMSVVPAAQAQVLQKSLGEIGDVDQYLVDELGYSSKEELYSYLAAEQVDSVALAIHQMNKGNAFIIGDMTGVGKGRQGAALIRYAVKQGKVPIYFTQKPTLFTDNYRDLADIGSSDLRPFIIASNPKDANIVDADGNVVHKLPSKKEQERVFNYIMEHGTLPDEYDYVLTTYDQIKNGTADYTQNEDGTWNTEARKLPKKSKGYTTADYNGQARRDALARLAEGNIAILDESHTVGGDSGCGRYMQMLTSSAEGVTFLSATFAKRADNMPIYAQRTAIAEAGVKASELIEAISKGGVTLQEIMSKQLVESGQMIRRERSFEGVTIDWLSVEEETNRRQRQQFNEVADIFNAIRNFQDDYITPMIDAKNEAAAEFGATVGHTQGTKDLGVKNVPFASKMYNLVNQLLFALKVDAVADRVVENLRNGYKPVISFTNTMEGFLSSAPKGVVMDDVPNFSLTLMRALDGVMRFTEKDADENTEGGSISLSDLSTEGQNAYNAIREKIINLSADLPISPMDAIRMKIEEAGYSVAEITGRTMQLNRTEDGKYIVEARKDRDKKAAMRDFNSGKLDVLMINKSGSTGISLHASSKFEDQRPRVMVFAQFQSDINDEVQMRGRIDRSGQVTRGRYEYIMSTIPAEQRIQMMFKAKLKSLDANTTSSQKSKFNEMEIVDYLNKYGDDVVWEYMKEHPELEERLGDPLDMLQEKKAEDGPRTSEKEDTSKKTGCAGKISRYLAFLSVEEQDEIFREITEAYRVKIQLLDDAGENDLEITTMPLRAETKRKQIWHEGVNPGSGNAFANNTYVEEVEVDVLKKPMKRDEIIETTRKLVGDKGIVTEYDQMRYGSKEGEVNWTRYAREKEAEISQFFQEKADEAVGKLREAGEARIAKAREKTVAAATKARGRGENNFTDTEIQSLADTVASEEREKEERKQDKRRSEIMGVKFSIQTLLNRLRAGNIYVVPQDLKQGTPEMFSQTFGTFVGFKFNKSYTLGSSTAIFATLDGRRKVELALSDPAINTIISATEMAYRYSPKEINAITMENWDSNVPTQTRQKRYIITGNLLQALVDTEKGEKTRGNLISYSTIDGETRQGILMGENFKLTDLRNSASLSSRLAQIREGKAVVSENGDVQIEKVSFGWQHRGQYELRVPKSKQRGGIYTMHSDLLKLVEGHNFITKGNNMVAYVNDTDIAKVVDMLSRAPFNLTVLQESQLTDTEILERQGDGYGAYSDAEVSYLNDTASKLAGKNRFSKKRQAEFAARERQRMADRIQELAEHLHLNNVEVMTDTSQLEGKRAEAKGFFNKRTGKITIVLPNNYGKIDAEQTLLHEAVAHYGLRKLFGKHFDTFLNNVYESAEPEIRRKIATMAAKYGWDFRTATEEYLAGLAEDTNFDEARAYGGWWSRIKRLFLDMLEKIGFEGFRDNTGIVITDNELRYLLWRSYENLRGRDKGIFRDAADVVKQVELKVGNYAEGGIEADYAAEPTDVGSINAQFNQELQQYENGTLPKGHRFELGMPSAYLRSAGFPNLPISMRSTLLATKAKMNRHPFDALNLKGLVEALQKPIAIFEYSKPNMRNLIVDVKRGDKHFLVGVTLNYKAGDIEINSVSGLFPKDSLEWLKWIQDGKAIRIDQKEKVQAIIDSQRTTNTVESERIGLNLDDAAKIVKSFENPTVEGEELFRPGDFTPRDKVLARDEYERMVSRSSFQAREAIQDSMLGLKELYKAISESEASVQDQEFRIEEIAGFENAYLFENRMSSINAAEQHEYFSRYMNPLLEEIGKIAGADERKRHDLTDYMMAKHGLERNEYMRNEAAANGEETERDFAGLTGLTGEADWRTAEATAQQWVADYETATDTSALWQAVNKATQATLERIYHSGIISKENYEKILGMYQYYIPLRGWNETTSEEVYGYLTSKDGPLGGSIMKKAEGRSSKADDPIATIAMMADDAIRQGNRNLMKQRFLNFILNHPSDTVSVHDIWLEYDDVADEWRPVFADVNATDTADEVARKVEAFEQRMEALQKNEPDKYKRGREAQHIPYKVVNNNLREHQVLIKRNGRTFVATINGNPRAAQAINGLTNPDVDQNGIAGNMLKAGSWLNRQLSAFYTTRNPDFVVGNFFRDTLYSNCMTWVKESPRYALRFHKNFGYFNPVTMRRLLGKWENGKLDMSNRLESLFYQFMKNGGETGYTNVRDIDSHKKAVAAELKKQGNIGRKVWSALGMQLDLLNRSAENCARFAAFVTSREFGRSIDRSIYDAKEVSVNFNKKGSGGKMVNAVGQTTLGKAASYLGGGGRLLYVFWNAGIQGMTNFSRQAKRHPAKFMVGASALFTLGYIIPALAEMLGGGDGDDDDKNAYYNLPEYVRRSNICFRAGSQWITIPLPIEYRAMYGMGELAHGVISGNERYSNSELAYQMASQVSQILPLDMLEGGGGISPFIPSAAKPFTEAYIMNKSWTGLPVYKDTPFNKNEPEWTKAYASTDKHLVSFAKWLNETTGGDDFTKGAIDINPAKIEYLLNGTFGGVFTFPNKVKKTVETKFGDRDFEWRNIPIANRLIKSGDERTAFRKLQNEYFKYKEESEETARRWRKYQKADEEGLMGYAEKVNFLENSPEYLRYEIFGDFKDDIAAIKEAREAEPNETKAKSLEAEYYGTMRELVDALHDPNSYFKKLYDAGQLNDEYVKFLEKHHGIKLRDAK